MKRERVGLVWDLGAGFGHVTKLTELADALAALGHEPIVVARNLRSFLAHWGDARHPLIAAPHNDWFVDESAAASPADILWNECGFHDALQLEALARAWRTSIERLRIDRLVVEGSPLAMFATAGLGVPRIAMGNGFLVPPPGPPWPAFGASGRWPDFGGGEVLERRLHEREALLERHSEKVLAKLGAAAGPLRDKLAPDAHALVTYAAFDPYGARGEVRYFAPAAGAGDPLPRELDGASFVFVYLQRNDARVAALLEATAALGLRTLAVLIGSKDERRDLLTIRGRAVHIRAALAQASCVVCHGGNLGQLASAAGVPLLALPSQVEQWSNARVIESHGAGLTLLGEPDSQVLKGAVAQLVHDPTFTRSAKRFGSELSASGASSFDNVTQFVLDAGVAAS